MCLCESVYVWLYVCVVCVCVVCVCGCCMCVSVDMWFVCDQYLCACGHVHYVCVLDVRCQLVINVIVPHPPGYVATLPSTMSMMQSCSSRS